MWTPRRIVLLAACFASFFLVYLGYAYTAVGRIDGLPPLPEAHWPDPNREFIPDAPASVSKLNTRLREAFGADCKEQKWAIRLEVQSGSMLIAAENLRFQDGKVFLSPLSVAMFGKKKDDLPPEINTIRSEVAMLTFDRPVNSFGDLSSRKIAEAELNGRIHVASNRRRAQRDQDLRVFINNGPVFYKESIHRIWTDAVVALEDYKVHPPHVIHGQGMEMELLTETPRGRGTGRKPGKETVSGVKWVTLNSGVDMVLHLEGQGGLMGPGPAKAAHDAPAAALPLEGHGAPRADGPAKVSAGTPPARGAMQKANAPLPGKAVLHITTPGRFRYDMNKDHDVATFDVLPAGRGIALPIDRPNNVEVTRTNPDGKKDHLVCHQLTLRLRRQDPAEAPTPKAEGKAAARAPKSPAKPPAPPANAEDRIEGAEVESLHAVADLSRPTSQVVLVANSNDGLSARGQDFFHDKVKGLTVLKGGPVEVERDDGSKITAREIRIQNVDSVAERGPNLPGGARQGGVPPRQGQAKGHQNIWATGPGDLLMVDKKEKKNTRAYWQKMLTSVREGEQDVLTLTGAARFVDEMADQSLRADVIKVWLDPPEARQATARDESMSAGRKPRHLEATGNVVARSRDMNIHDTGRLVVRFKDEPPQATLPAVGRPNPPRQGPPRQGPSGAEGAPAPAPARLPLPAGAPAPAQLTGKQNPAPPVGPELTPPDNRPPARPFDLSARSVEAWILRGPAKSSIDQLFCDGSVNVRQDPANAGERGTEVKGDTLRMTAGGDGGYLLVVTADQENVAELTTDKIYVMGPEINIDQTGNKAWVIGSGAMKMESETNFQGEKLDKPVPLVVFWDKRMWFTGESAEFRGNITAEQEKASLACQHLQVTFDRPISLKEGNKKDQPARVRQMLCDENVRVEESVFTDRKLTKYSRLEGPVVYMTAEEPEAPSRPPAPGGKAARSNKVVVSGGGNLRVWEPGSGEELPGLTIPAPGAPGGGGTNPPKTRPAPPRKPPEMKMTYVDFKQQMTADSKTNKASFWGDVRVLNLPCPAHNAVINLDTILIDRLPEGAIFIKCRLLHVLDRPSEGRSNKQMEGHDNVYVQGREFYARATAIYYNQLKDQIILDGSDGTPAELTKDPPVGQKQKFEGRRIIYTRKTGEISGQGVSSIKAESPRGR